MTNHPAIEVADRCRAAAVAGLPRAARRTVSFFALTASVAVVVPAARAQAVDGNLWVAADGSVNAIAVNSGTLYIAGTFTRIGPPTGGAVALDATTGQPLSLPKVEGAAAQVLAVAPDGAGGW
jgi:hypothetical protein